MTTKMNTELKRPSIDTKKADAAVQKIIRENKQWLKEMADK